MPQAILEPTCTSQIHPTAGEGRIGMTDGITLADQDVVSLDKIADGLIGLRILLVNVYAVSNGSDWVLVDAGLYLSASRIRRWAQAHFGDRKPAAIVLTHGHFDHVGALKDLLDEWDVPVFAHEPEMPYLQGRLSYPAPRAAAGGGLMSVLAPFYPRGPIDLGNRVQTLPADGAVPALSGWRWVHTPGHTAGHISLFRDSDQTLVVGDAFCTTKQESALAIATQKAELHGHLPITPATGMRQSVRLSCWPIFVRELLPPDMDCQWRE